MGDVVRRMSWSGANMAEAELLLRREWLVNNGLGGYESGTISGVPTRRYHGLVIAALSFGHLPAVFIPAGPMTSGIPNDQKAKVRQQFAAGCLPVATTRDYTDAAGKIATAVLWTQHSW